jgi:hypothetical protein
MEVLARPLDNHKDPAVAVAVAVAVLLVIPVALEIRGQQELQQLTTAKPLLPAVPTRFQQVAPEGRL